MAQSKISFHEAKVFRALQRHDDWLTSKEIAKESEVAERTARHHASRFVELNICDVRELSPGHRYRFAVNSIERNPDYTKRLEDACKAFGL